MKTVYRRYTYQNLAYGNLVVHGCSRKHHTSYTSTQKSNCQKCSQQTKLKLTTPRPSHLAHVTETQLTREITTDISL